MSKSIYFASSSRHMKHLPDYETLARMHRLSYAAQPVTSGVASKSVVVPGFCSRPLPAGMRVLNDHPDYAEYEFVDLTAFFDGPASDDEGFIAAEMCEEHDHIEVAQPEWAVKFKAELQRRNNFNMQQPIIFHLPTYSTTVIADLVKSVCVDLALPFAEIKGNADDGYFDLLRVTQSTSLVTYLNDPDLNYLQSSWAHQRQGNIWFWVSPFPLTFQLGTVVIPLPYEDQHADLVLLENSVLLADRTAALRQINQLAATKNESQKVELLKKLIQPKPLRMASQADVDAISVLKTECPQFGALLGKLRSRLVGQCLSKYPIHLGSQLLIGPPGNGKTWLCTKIANALNLPFLNLQLAGNGDVMVLRGSQQQWTGSDAGRPAKFIATCGIANPIILLDEVDKASGSQHGNLSDTILMLLEPENSRSFMDNFVETPINMSHISFILTANDTDCLSAPLKSRLEVNSVLSPSKQEMREFAQNFYQRELKERNISQYFVSVMGEADLQVIVFRSESIRELRRQIVLAIENGLNDVTDVSAIETQQYLLKPIPAPEPPKNNPSPGIGFLTKH
ncbi:AAA family ATPase [uncultured Deefgea sp.]|uniref:AAA family ATPase n=1 Tax=uncultured Deefgea sp. TaxID=1304914 RepID=UPI002621537B|nr:AAA family ATPase [uncultured Deefgea sp.]